MKRIIFFKCFKIDEAIQTGLQSFNKEAGYPVHEKEEQSDEYAKQMNSHFNKKPFLKVVKLLAILKNIF